MLVADPLSAAAPDQGPYHAPPQIDFVTVSVGYGPQVTKVHSPPAIMEMWAVPGFLVQPVFI